MDYLPLWLLAVCMAVTSQQLVHAQSTATIYNTVDQPPHLHGGEADHSFQALEQTLIRSFRYPSGMRPQQVNGECYSEVMVTELGKVTHTGFDQYPASGNVPLAVYGAIRTAVGQLPTLSPAQHAHQPIAAWLTIRWIFGSFSDPNVHMAVVIERRKNEPELIELSGVGAPPAEAFDPNTTYTYVEQMPRLPKGTGKLVEIEIALEQALVLPANAQEGRVFVSFVVNQQGKVGEAKIVKGLDAVTDGAVLAAVRRLPSFLPGRQNNQPVRVAFTVPISVHLASKRPQVQPAKH